MSLGTCLNRALDLAPIQTVQCLFDLVSSSCSDVAGAINNFIQENRGTKLFTAAELAAGAAGVYFVQKGIRDYKKGETHKGFSEACAGVACLTLFALTNEHIERSEAALLLLVSLADQYYAAPGKSRSFFRV